MRVFIQLFFLLCFSLSSVLTAQEAALTAQEAEFNAIYSAIPAEVPTDSLSIPSNRFFRSKLQPTSIGNLYTYYRFQEEMGFTAAEIQWMSTQIDRLAEAFYLENRPLFLRKTGGYAGCDSQKVGNENYLGKQVTVLYFCFTCAGASSHEVAFMERFNRKTEALLTR